jgi:hypothetical protein
LNERHRGAARESLVAMQRESSTAFLVYSEPEESLSINGDVERRVIWRDTGTRATNTRNMPTEGVA